MIKDEDSWLVSISQFSAQANSLVKQSNGLPIVVLKRGRPVFYAIHPEMFVKMSKDLAQANETIERLTRAQPKFNFLSKGVDDGIKE